MADLLAVANISKSFPGVRALHEVGFSIGEGECVALIGENGAGKSTLMKILAGVQPPDSGEIRLNKPPCYYRNQVIFGIDRLSWSFIILDIIFKMYSIKSLLI